MPACTLGHRTRYLKQNLPVGSPRMLSTNMILMLHVEVEDDYKHISDPLPVFNFSQDFDVESKSISIVMNVGEIKF